MQRSSVSSRSRNAPCDGCRRVKRKCLWSEDTEACVTCVRAGFVCSGPTRIRDLKCVSCSSMKVRCEWVSDTSTVCVRCTRTRKLCSGARGTEGVIPSRVLAPPSLAIGPSSASARIFANQLSLSLAYHCIWMCCSNDHVSFSGVDPAFYMEYFHMTREVSRRSHHIPFYEEVLTSLIIFAGATLSNHSAVVGSASAPSFLTLLAPSIHTLKSPSSFPILSAHRTTSLRTLSSTLADHTIAFLRTPDLDLASTQQQLGLVRVVLSKATAVDAAWQATVCKLALSRGLRMLKRCKASERDALIALVRNFAFKSLLNAANDSLQGPIPLSQLEFDLIFDPAGPYPTITLQNLYQKVYSPFTSHQTFIKFSWHGIFRHLYTALARTFFSLVQPFSKVTLSDVWDAVDRFRCFKRALFEDLLVGLRAGNEDWKWARYGTIVRSLTTFEANYYKMALTSRRILRLSSQDEGMAERREREITPGIAEGVALILSLPVAFTRKLEVLNHQITVILKIPPCSLARDLAELSASNRESLLQGIKAFAMTVQGATVALLDAMVELLAATAGTFAMEREAAIHVGSAALDVLRPSPADEQVTALFVLVVDSTEPKVV